MADPNQPQYPFPNKPSLTDADTQIALLIGKTLLPAATTDVQEHMGSTSLVSLRTAGLTITLTNPTPSS
jgi:hypothetical protein